MGNVGNLPPREPKPLQINVKSTQNQPQPVDLIIDNVAPLIKVTHITQQINLADTDNVANSATINGTASDAGQIATLSLIMRKPNGDTFNAKRKK